MRCGVLLRALLFVAIVIGASCSVPNLETAPCAEARNSVKRFYSLHFADHVTPNAEYLRASEELLTEGLKSKLSSDEDSEDFFTKTLDFPKAFRVGPCTSPTEGSAELQVVLLWRDDVRNEQAEVTVEVLKVGTEWRIDNVEK